MGAIEPSIWRQHTALATCILSGHHTLVRPYFPVSHEVTVTHLDPTRPQQLIVVVCEVYYTDHKNYCIKISSVYYIWLLAGEGHRPVWHIRVLEVILGTGVFISIKLKQECRMMQKLTRLCTVLLTSLDAWPVGPRVTSDRHLSCHRRTRVDCLV